MAPYNAWSRLILPEVVGDDEQLVAQGSAFVQAVTQLTQPIAVIIGPLGFLAVGQALQYVGMKVVFLAIAAGFTAGAIAFSAAVRRSEANGEEKADAVPAGDLATVLPAEARAD